MNTALTIPLAVVAIFLTLVTYNCLFSKLIKQFLIFGYDQLRDEARDLLADQKIKKIHKETKIELQKELDVFELLKLSKDKHTWLNTLMGNIEFVLFALATVLILTSYNNLFRYDASSRLFIITAGWLGIKIVGNYGQWSGDIYGRATYYMFFLGSILNIGFGIMIGSVLAYIFK